MPFCDQTKQYTDQPQLMDTLTPSGQASRSNIYAQMGANQGAINKGTQAQVQALQSGAANPGWASAQSSAARTAAGGYLGGSPELTGQLNANYNRALSASADQNARIQDQYAKSGMSFSTGNQQAQQANTAAAAGQAQGQNAQIIGQNYGAERQLQAQSPQQLAAATGGQAALLGQVPGAYLNPLQQQAGITSGLSTGQIATPSTAIYNQPGLLQQSGLPGLISSL